MQDLILSKVIDDHFQLINNVLACVSVVLCVYTLVEYRLRSGDNVVDNSLVDSPQIFDHPSEMTEIQSALSMVCLTFVCTLLNSSSTHWMAASGVSQLYRLH